MSVNRKSKSAFFVQHGSLKKQWSEITGSNSPSKINGKLGKKSKKSKRKRKHIPVIEVTVMPEPKPLFRFTSQGYKYKLF